MAGQHPLADPDQLDKCMGLGKAPETSPRYPLDIPPQEGSAHDELRRGQRPIFFFKSSQFASGHLQYLQKVTMTWIYSN